MTTRSPRTGVDVDQLHIERELLDLALQTRIPPFC